MSFPQKLIKIQALIDRTSSKGEREAAALAKERVLQKQQQGPKEFLITLHSIWQKSIFLALCKKYGLHTHRYPRQKNTTTVVLVTPAFLDELLWPEYLKYSSLLQDHILDVVDSVIEKIENGDTATSIVNQVGREANPPDLT